MSERSLEETVWRATGARRRAELARELEAIRSRREQIEPWALDLYDNGFAEG